MSDARASRSWQVCWLLLQTFWVGGLWGLHFVVLPGIGRIGLAPLLVQEIRLGLVPMLLGLTACAVLMQGLVLARLCGLRALWRDLRGLMLIAAQSLIAIYFITRLLLPDQEYWLIFSYLAVAMCGLVLLLQGVPEKRGCGLAE